MQYAVVDSGFRHRAGRFTSSRAALDAIEDAGMRDGGYGCTGQPRARYICKLIGDCEKMRFTAWKEGAGPEGDCSPANMCSRSRAQHLRSCRDVRCGIEYRGRVPAVAFSSTPADVLERHLWCRLPAHF